MVLVSGRPEAEQLRTNRPPVANKKRGQVLGRLEWRYLLVLSSLKSGTTSRRWLSRHARHREGDV